MATQLHGLSLKDTIGAVELGSFFSMILLGVVTLQVHMYFSHFPNDRWYIKALVVCLFLLEIAQSFCIAAEIYKATVINYGRPDKLFPFPFIGASTAIGGSIGLVSHTFFSSRLYLVLPKPWNLIGAGCFVLAIARFIGSAVLGNAAVQASVLEEYAGTWGWLITTLLAAGVVIDVIITSSMMFYLMKKRGKLFTSSVRLVDRLIQYTVSTGLIPSLVAVVMIIVFLVRSNSMEWLAIYTCYSKLYSNSVLANLNSRISLRAHLSQSTSGDPSLGIPNRGTRRDGETNQMVISVEMKSTVQHDDMPYSKQYALGRKIDSPEATYHSPSQV